MTPSMSWPENTRCTASSVTWAHSGAHIDRPNYDIIARKPFVTAECNFTFVYRLVRQHVAPVLKLDFVHSPISACDGPVAAHVKSVMRTAFASVGQLKCVKSSDMSPVKASLHVYADDVMLRSPPAVVLPGDPETTQPKEMPMLT